MAFDPRPNQTTMNTHLSRRALLGGLLGAATGARARPMPLPVFGFDIVQVYPHDPSAFTQGLLFRDGFLFESTGLIGRSSLRKVELASGRVLQHKSLPSEVFGEGITVWQDEIVALTWRSQLGFVFDAKTFALKRQFSYPGEGWGLTHSPRHLIQSDGSAQLRFIDPQTLREVHRIVVTAQGKPVDQLNELEWVRGEIFANIWQTDRIARIDPACGQVLGWIDLAGLLESHAGPGVRADVLNGIAYDTATGRLFVTGKLWPHLFEIRLVPRPA